MQFAHSVLEPMTLIHHICPRLRKEGPDSKFTNGSLTRHRESTRPHTTRHVPNNSTKQQRPTNELPWKEQNIFAPTEISATPRTQSLELISWIKSPAYSRDLPNMFHTYRLYSMPHTTRYCPTNRARRANILGSTVAVSVGKCED